MLDLIKTTLKDSDVEDRFFLTCFFFCGLLAAVIGIVAIVCECVKHIYVNR
jgi:hypothetical protein